jgi:hypothetical protein
MLLKNDPQVKGDKMKIEVELNSPQTTPEQKQKIKDDIESEILHHHEKMLKKPTTKLTVSLFDVPHSQTLSGTAVNEEGEEAIKITYQLHGDTQYHYC